VLHLPLVRRLLFLLLLGQTVNLSTQLFGLRLRFVVLRDKRLECFVELIGLLLQRAQMLQKADLLLFNRNVVVSGLVKVMHEFLNDSHALTKLLRASVVILVLFLLEVVVSVLKVSHLALKLADVALLEPK
jgi:hypothetical protein